MKALAIGLGVTADDIIRIINKENLSSDHGLRAKALIDELPEEQRSLALELLEVLHHRFAIKNREIDLKTKT